MQRWYGGLSMRAASRSTTQWCFMKPGFSVVPDFVVKTVVTRFAQDLDPVWEITNLHSPGRPHGSYRRGANMLRLRKQKATSPKNDHIAAERRRL